MSLQCFFYWISVLFNFIFYFLMLTKLQVFWQETGKKIMVLMVLAVSFEQNILTNHFYHDKIHLGFCIFTIFSSDGCMPCAFSRVHMLL